MPAMRAKLRISRIETTQPGTEVLHMNAVGPSGPYGPDGSDENNTFARFTPDADLRIVIANPALIDQFRVGETYYCNFSLADPVAAKPTE